MRESVPVLIHYMPWVAIEFQGVPRVFRIGHKENMVIEYVYFDPGQADCKKNYCIPQTLYPSKFDGVAI